MPNQKRANQNGQTSAVNKPHFVPTFERTAIAVYYTGCGFELSNWSDGLQIQNVKTGQTWIAKHFSLAMSGLIYFDPQ